MACVKTAISMDESLFKQANELARKMHVSRSKLVSLALEAFVEKHKADALIQRINQACADYPDEEDEAFFRFAEANLADLTKDEEW